MVQFFNLPQDPKSRLAEQMGLGLGQGVNQIVQQQYQRGLLQNALGKVGDVAKSGQGPLPTILAALSAGAGIPGSEKYIGALLPILEKLATVNASHNAPLPLEDRQRLPLEAVSQRQQLPGFLGEQNPQAQQTGQFFPTVKGPEGGPGQAPQAATRGIKEPVLSPKEELEEGRKFAAAQTAAGNPMTTQEGVEAVKGQNDRVKQYNKLVDEETQQRVNSQREYGNVAEEYLKENYPDASRELTTIFQKEGESLSKQGMSEADINRTLEGKAKNIKNAIVNAEKEYSAPRIYNQLSKAMNKEYKSFDQAAKDVRQHIQPLIDMGLYDTARNILSKKGYGLEEREAILHPLSDQSISRVNQVPKISSKFAKVGSIGFPEANSDQINEMKEALKDMKANDPNFSLALARKAFEDRGYDWRSFKDALNSLVDEGFKLEDDQRNHLGELDSPPLNLIEELLHGINLIGR